MRRLALLPCLAALLVLPGSAGAVETGINSQDLSPSETASRASDLNAVWIRRFVRWDEIQPSQGVWNGAPVDYVRQLKAAAPNHKIALVVTGAPSWANGSSDPLVPPQNPQDYAAFVGRLAAELKGKVSLWEIWNEADGETFWHGSLPSAEAYTALLKPAYTTIKFSDPAAQVNAGPLTGNNYPFLEEIYKNGGQGYFDGVSVHTDTACRVKGPDSFFREPDGRISKYSWLGFREVHEVMAKNGDSDKTIAMSEFGWSTASGICENGRWAGMKPAGVSEEQQSSFLTQAYRCMAAYPYMQSGMWFTLHDAGPLDTEMERYGLLRYDFTPRPSYWAMRQMGAGPITPADSCGDFDGPALTVISPLEGTDYNHALYLEASAKDDRSPVRRIRFLYKDKVVGSFSWPGNGQAVGRSWIGARELPFGEVEITAEARDDIGNTERQSITVKHVNPRKLSSQKTSLVLSVAGKGHYRTLEGSGRVAGSQLTPTGKVLVKFQRRSGSRWVTRFERRKNIPYGFSLKRKFSRGTWRALVSYAGQKPFSSASASKAFKVS